MSDIGGGNSAFDATFFAIERAGAIVVAAFLLTLFALRRARQPLPSWAAVPFIGAAVALGPGISLFWQIAYPSANGIEGAGRFMLGGAITLANAAFAGAGAFGLLDRRSRWLAFSPAAANALYWVAFLFN